MSGRDGEMFAFDSSENIHPPTVEGSSIDSINFSDEEGEASNYLTPMNFQTARRIEQAQLMLRNNSLIFYESIRTGEPASVIRAKLKARLSPNWSEGLEHDLFSPSTDPPFPCRDYTIVTPSNTFIETDDIPHNGSFVSSYGTVGSYKTFSPGSFKSSDRLKNFK